MEENKRWSGVWHIVNSETNESLESWSTQEKALYFCKAVNEHEVNNSRIPVYFVEERKSA